MDKNKLIEELKQIKSLSIYDHNMGQFYMQYYITKSAIAKGFQVPFFSELCEIGKENGSYFETD